MTNTILKILILASFLGVLFSCLATAQSAEIDPVALAELRELLQDDTPIAHVSIDRSDVEIEFVPTVSVVTVQEEVEIIFVADK